MSWYGGDLPCDQTCSHTIDQSENFKVEELRWQLTRVDCVHDHDVDHVVCPVSDVTWRLVKNDKPSAHFLNPVRLRCRACTSTAVSVMSMVTAIVKAAEINHCI